MATFFPKRSFFEKDGKIFFLRGRAGPTYAVKPAERDEIIRVTHKLHLKMLAIIGVSFGSFGVFVVFLPEVLDLPFNIAMGIMLALIVASLVPLGLTLRFHLTHQDEIRRILGTKTSVEFGLNEMEKQKIKSKNPPKPAQTPSLMDLVRQRERKFRFFWVFLLGIVLASLGVTVLFSLEELTYKTLFIWIVIIMTGLGLLLVGTLGIVYRIRDAKTPEAKLRK